jgi:broad specificity phosphatase PhoE
MRLYLVRHGQTAWNREGRCQGHTDIPLDDEGLRQAERLAECFTSDFPIAKVYASNLSRCSETARPLAQRLSAELVIDPRLRERSSGDWDGLLFSEMMSLRSALMESLGCDHTTIRPPNGESLVDVWERLSSFVDELLTVEDSVVVVAHGASGTLLLSRLINGTIETARSLSFLNTGVTELEKREGGYFTLRRYNDTSHLASDAAIGGGVDGIHR